ncbi:MAG: hypothetical protein OIF35_03815 [Cellvibrionaceae bacterium]|nr:hypothetical protein [Cellvibrionaceae bacterium]MCV6626628.1 hypothetical protein [Cellvibrionaceae bacterium]
MTLKSVGQGGTLLTAAEARCYQLGRQLQRKALIQAAFGLAALKQDLLPTSLNWSNSAWRFVLQLAIYLVCLPFMLVYQLGRRVYLWLLLPFRYLETFFTPADFEAPGEKNLEGIDRQFSRCFRLQGNDYIYCLNQWVKILYGTDKAKYHNFVRYIHCEQRSLVEQGIDDPNFLAVTQRKQLAAARARLSQNLGNY